MNKKIILVFIALIFTSPWFWIFQRNYKEILNFNKSDFYQISNPILISEINTFQGETRLAEMGFLGKLIINKYTWFFKDMLTQFLESYDFHYLFMEGDLNLLKSTRSSGPLFLSLFPFVCYGIYRIFRRKKYPLLFLVLVSPIFGCLFRQHYETLSRLPFILSLTLMAAVGIVAFSEKSGYKILKGLFLVFFSFEFLRFIHYYFLHYPFLLQR